MDNDYLDRLLENVKGADLAEVYRAGLEGRLPALEIFDTSNELALMETDEDWAASCEHARKISPSGTLPWEMFDDTQGVTYTNLNKKVLAYRQFRGESDGND